jgi:hypothetical protein
MAAGCLLEARRDLALLLDVIYVSTYVAMKRQHQNCQHFAPGYRGQIQLGMVECPWFVKEGPT